MCQSWSSDNLVCLHTCDPLSFILSFCSSWWWHQIQSLVHTKHAFCHRASANPGVLFIYFCMCVQDKLCCQLLLERQPFSWMLLFDAVYSRLAGLSIWRSQSLSYISPEDYRHALSPWLCVDTGYSDSRPHIAWQALSPQSHCPYRLETKSRNKTRRNLRS